MYTILALLFTAVIFLWIKKRFAIRRDYMSYKYLTLLDKIKSAEEAEKLNSAYRELIEFGYSCRYRIEILWLKELKTLCEEKLKKIGYPL